MIVTGISRNTRRKTTVFNKLLNGMPLPVVLSTRLYTLLLLMACCLPAWTQSENSSRTIPIKQLDNLVQGRLYYSNYFPIKGSPFLTQKWVLDDVHLLGKDYTDLPIWYDIYIDELVMLQQHGQNLHFIRFNKAQVQHFNIQERRFVNLTYTPYHDLGLKDGYYELAFADKVTLLIKRHLEVQEEAETMISYFSRNDRWILIKEGQVFNLQGKKSILATVTREQRGGLSSFIKKQKIRFKRAGDQEWLQLATYLNTLQPEGI